MLALLLLFNAGCGVTVFSATSHKGEVAATNTSGSNDEHKKSGDATDHTSTADNSESEFAKASQPVDISGAYLVCREEFTAVVSGSDAMATVGCGVYRAGDKVTWPVVMTELSYSVAGKSKTAAFTRAPSESPWHGVAKLPMIDLDYGQTVAVVIATPTELAGKLATKILPAEPTFLLTEDQSKSVKTPLLLNDYYSKISVGSRQFFATNQYLVIPDEGGQVLGYASPTFLTAGGTLPPTGPLDPLFAIPKQASHCAYNGDTISAMSICQANSVAVAGSKLIVADHQNNRVLIWNSLPTVPDVPADVVLGQADFTSFEPNNSPQTSSLQGLYGPKSVAIDGERLIVNDSLNQRILIWNSIPTKNFAVADVEIGAGTGTNADDGASVFLPDQLIVAGGKLIVADAGRNRVLIWNEVPTKSGTRPDIVLGQPDFSTFTAGIGANKMTFPTSVASDGRMLFVLEWQPEHRLLVWNRIPTKSSVPPDHIITRDMIYAALDLSKGEAEIGALNSVSFVDGILLLKEYGGNNRFFSWFP